MNSRSIIVFCVCLAGAVSFYSFADSTTDLWANVYRNTQTVNDRYDVMLGISKINNNDFVPFLLEVLEDLVKEKIANDTLAVIELKDKIKVLAVRMLGDYGEKRAGPLFSQIIKESNNPLLRREALISMGKIREGRYAQEIAVLLYNLTVTRGQDVQNEEYIVYGCIYALERLREPVGYIPVFYVLSRGYSRLILEMAARALIAMVDDPTELLIEVIKDPTTIAVKQLALEQAFVTPMPDSQKIRVMLEGLKQGLTLDDKTIPDETGLRELRKDAMTKILAVKTNDPESVILLEQILYFDKADVNEQLLAVDNLCGIHSEEASKVLVKYLAMLNKRQSLKLPVNERIAMAVVTSFAKNKTTLALEALLTAKYSNYPASVAEKVEEALKGIMGK
ncbi:MAG: hypothetical protein JW969_06160 [Spirochaetales bacterium]|nr:hypothetical protein [Spirochaetales bacterium]